MRLTSTTGFRAAICAAAAALLVVLATPTPAFANNLMVSGTAADVGESPGTSTVTIRNADIKKANGVKIAVSVSGEAANYVDVSIGGGCKGEGSTANCGKVDRMGTKTFTVTLKQKADSGLRQGESKTGSIDFRIGAPHTGSATSAPVTVNGFTQVAKAITGTVTDLDDKPIEGASVNVKDDGGTDYGSTKTGGDGKFNISAEVQPDTNLKVKVTKKGYRDKTVDYTVVSGQPIAVEARMEKKEAKNSGPAPKPEEDESGGGPEESGFTFITWVLIILGVLLAIGGVFAIWMLLRKGKEDDDDEEKLPDEPVTHQLSASQTGKFGVYEASGSRPGTDNPTMLHSGGLINDDDLARYGSEPPGTPGGAGAAGAAGFGPAYSDNQATQVARSTTDPASNAATQRYAANEPVSGGWRSNEPVSGGWQANQPVSGSTQRYPAAEPASGSWRSNEPVSGGWQANQPVSGSTQRYPAAEPASGSWRSNEPASGGWQANQPVSGSTQRYPAADPGSDGWYPSGDAYGDRGGQYDDRGPRQYREPDSYGGYGDQPRQPPGRRYRDDDYGDFDDRPRSW